MSLALRVRAGGERDGPDPARDLRRRHAPAGRDRRASCSRTRSRRRCARRSCSGSRSACGRRPVAGCGPVEGGGVRLFVQRSDVGEFRRRYRWMVLVVDRRCSSCSSGGSCSSSSSRATCTAPRRARNIVREGYLATTRGVIRDAHGRVLAANRPAYNVYVMPWRSTWRRRGRALARLARLDDAERASLEQTARASVARSTRRTGGASSRSCQGGHRSRRGRRTSRRTRTSSPGIEVAPSPVRYYPYGALGAHLLGYMREVEPRGARLARRARLPRGRSHRARSASSGAGRATCAGSAGCARRVRGAGRRLDMAELEAKYLEEPRRVEPIPGRDVSLTVDIELVRGDGQGDARPARGRRRGGRRAHRPHPGGAVQAELRSERGFRRAGEAAP